VQEERAKDKIEKKTMRNGEKEKWRKRQREGKREMETRQRKRVEND
jgi:hypothetical protein